MYIYIYICNHILYTYIYIYTYDNVYYIYIFIYDHVYYKGPVPSPSSSSSSQEGEGGWGADALGRPQDDYKSGVVGVSWVGSELLWKAKWKSADGKWRTKQFSVVKFGFDDAKRLAIQSKLEANVLEPMRPPGQGSDTPSHLQPSSSAPTIAPPELLGNPAMGTSTASHVPLPSSFSRPLSTSQQQAAPPHAAKSASSSSSSSSSSI
jgi:hypothetical protein